MSRPHNRPIATGDHGAGKSPAPPKLSEQGVLQFGEHKGSPLSETPLGYLKWLSRKRVLSGEDGAQKALDGELAKRKQSPQPKPSKELVSAMGFVMSGRFEQQNIAELPTKVLWHLLKTSNLREKSKARIELQIKKKSRKQNSRKKKRSKR